MSYIYQQTYEIVMRHNTHFILLVALQSYEIIS